MHKFGLIPTSPSLIYLSTPLGYCHWNVITILPKVTLLVSVCCLIFKPWDFEGWPTLWKNLNIAEPWTSVIFSPWKIKNCPWKDLEFDLIKCAVQTLTLYTLTPIPKVIHYFNHNKCNLEEKIVYSLMFQQYLLNCTMWKSSSMTKDLASSFETQPITPPYKNTH